MIATLTTLLITFIFPITSISDTVAKDKKIYLYCRSGNRSGKATKILNEAGYSQAINAGSITKAKELLNRDIIYN